MPKRVWRQIGDPGRHGVFLYDVVELLFAQWEEPVCGVDVVLGDVALDWFGQVVSQGNNSVFVAFALANMDKAAGYVVRAEVKGL